MSRRRKLEKFGAILSYPNVYEMTEPRTSLLRKNVNEVEDLRGKWSSVFPSKQPLCLELACGRGEYTVALARRNPHINYIGVDIKGARIFQGATIAIDEDLSNVAFLRVRIEHIDNYFSPDEVDEIWITFPDPFPAKENRRVTSPRFLEGYHKILKSEGVINFKTDDDELFEYSLEMINNSELFRLEYSNENIYAAPLYIAALEIKTYYEKMHLKAKKTIKYLQLVKNN